MATGELAGRVPELLERVQSDLLASATAARDARVADVATVAEALEAASTGFARIPWSALAGDGVEALGREAVTVRCLQGPDGEVPDTEDAPGVVALCARAY
jgi:prolyl-tRNA synthetase